MHQIFLEQHHRFISDIHELSFYELQNKFIEHQNGDGIVKMIGEYVPKLYQYQQEFDQHKRQTEIFRKVPSFDGKKEFDNTDNLHRKVIGIFKAFMGSQIKDLREYLRLTTDIDQLSHLISRIQILRFKSQQFNLVYYLFTASRRSIRIFLRLREQIIKICTFTPEQYLPISTHNSAKYKEKYHYIDKISLSRNKKQWEFLINLAGFQYDEEFTSLVFTSKEQVAAVELIEYCLWLNKQTASQNTSPTK